MALDTKQKQGSAMLIGMPFRPWLTEPQATPDAGDRLSLLRLCSDPTPAAVAFRPAWARGANVVIYRRKR